MLPEHYKVGAVIQSRSQPKCPVVILGISSNEYVRAAWLRTEWRGPVDPDKPIIGNDFDRYCDPWTEPLTDEEEALAMRWLLTYG